MIDESTYNELDRYFHSAMSAHEKSAFESRMNASEELRTEFAWLGVMLGGMKQQGRSIMKQTIANAIAGVPAGAVAKYNPSVNGKSFLKKYKWIFITLVATAIGLGVYLYVNRHVEHEGDHSDSEGWSSQELINEASPSIADSVKKSAPPSRTDTAHVQRESGEDDTEYNNVAIHDEGYPVMVTKKDSFIQLTNVDGGQDKVNLGGQRTEPMKTRINKRTQPPYSYMMDANLTLNANYTSTAGFTFSGSGDTVIMTDNNGLRFRLLRNKGEQPLVPMGRDK
jgi:hypothetical protein